MIATIEYPTNDVSDTHLIALIENAPSLVDDNVLTALKYLSVKYDIDMQTEDGDWKYTKDLLAELKQVINHVP